MNGCIEYGFIYFDNDKFSCFLFLFLWAFIFFLISSGNLFYLILKPVGFSLFLEGLSCSQLQFYDVLTRLSLVAEDANACIVQFFPDLLYTYSFLKCLSTLGIPLYFKNKIPKSGMTMDTCRRRMGHGLDGGQCGPHCKTVSKYRKGRM